MVNRPKKPKKPKKKIGPGGEVSDAQLQEVVTCLRKGMTWYEAMSDVFGLMPGAPCSFMAHRLKADARMKMLLRDFTPPALPPMDDVLNDLRVARDYAMSQADAGQIASIAMKKAELHGLIRTPEEIDKRMREFQAMNDGAQKQQLIAGLTMLDELSRKLRDRGLELTITDSGQRPASPQRAPALVEGPALKSASDHPATPQPAAPSESRPADVGGS